jgi:UBX domain
LLVHDHIIHTTRGGAIIEDDDDDQQLESGGRGVTSMVLTVATKILAVVWAVISSVWNLLSSLLSSNSADPTTSNKTGSSSKSTPAVLLDRLAALDMMTEPLPDCLVVTGTLTEALATARREARLLVALTTTRSESAIRAILSPQVLQVANKKSRKVSPNGSFFIWIGDDLPRSSGVGAAGAGASLSRDKLYVLMASSSSSPKILGQSALPQSSSDGPRLAEYLGDLRRRHRQLLLALHQRRQEQVWDQERRDHYSQSVVADERQREERRQAVEREKAAAAALATRAAQIVARRAVLQRELPDEPPLLAATTTTTGNSGNIVVVAIRLPDGRKAQRRFLVDNDDITTTTAVLFNWVDVVFEHEREKVQLQTLDGSKTFTYELHRDEPLTATTQGKKAIAFRVVLLDE